MAPSPHSTVSISEDGECLRIGAAMFDITGPAAEAGMFGYATVGQLTSGIHMRLRARAFAFHDPVSQTHCVFVCAELGMVSEWVTQTVVTRLETHPALPKGIYTRENVMISATHTHCAPGGLSHYFIYSVHPPLHGADRQNFECVVSGIVEAVVRAHRNLHPAVIRVATGLCLGASVNRSADAYLANPEQERAHFEHDTDKTMTLWRFDGLDGYPIGMINWFAVHPTSMGNWYTLITGDNKGYAAYEFEREQGTRHLMDRPRAFVAAFAQSNEGDVSPNICGPRHPCTQHKDFERMVTVANAQLDSARKLYADALTTTPIAGRIRFAHQEGDQNKGDREEEYTRKLRYLDEEIDATLQVNVTTEKKNDPLIKGLDAMREKPSGAGVSHGSTHSNAAGDGENRAGQEERRQSLQQRNPDGLREMELRLSGAVRRLAMVEEDIERLNALTAELSASDRHRTHGNVGSDNSTGNRRASSNNNLRTELVMDEMEKLRKEMYAEIAKISEQQAENNANRGGNNNNSTSIVAMDRQSMVEAAARQGDVLTDLFSQMTGRELDTRLYNSPEGQNQFYDNFIKEVTKKVSSAINSDKGAQRGSGIGGAANANVNYRLLLDNFAQKVDDRLEDAREFTTEELARLRRELMEQLKAMELDRASRSRTFDAQ
ncbi:Guanine nucleotide-binding protein 3 [Phytophthora nicotianae]|uniref:Neutral ceramidase n=1 Tax=Phytophthora nicotianae TaxID=4792 RepID=A0A0W8DH97_PHYNI|nr:Guanine nucleotide-binding protein 3 [Phytophthora nicotianae]